MANEPIEPVVAPVVPVQDAAPIAPVESVIAPAAPVEPVQAAVVEAAPVVAPAETPAPEAHKEPTTLLSTEPKPVVPEPAPVEVTPVEPKNEGGQSDEPAPPPKYEPFVLPENIKLGDTELGEFTNILAGLELEGKADHAVTQQTGQKLVNFHVNEVKKAVEAVHQHNIESWEKTRNEWKESFLKDPEIGGNRFQTTVDAALTFIRTHGGTPEQQTEFKQIMESSGLGNHPAMIRMLANAQLAMDEGRVISASAPPAAPKSKVTTLYGKG